MAINTEKTQEEVGSLIGELEHILTLLQDGNFEEAMDELVCQMGTIQTIVGDY
jgi:soluble cytochrome b562